MGAEIEAVIRYKLQQIHLMATQAMLSDTQTGLNPILVLQVIEQSHSHFSPENVRAFIWANMLRHFSPQDFKEVREDMKKYAGEE